MLKKLILPVIVIFTLSVNLTDAREAKKTTNNFKTSITTDSTDASGVVYPCRQVYGRNWNIYRAHPHFDSIPQIYEINLDGFSMPVSNNNITSGFGKRWGRNHNGVDIRASIGDTVYAAFSGKVRVARYNANGYGNFVVIRHHNGLETVYGHLSKHLVEANDYVETGQPIGLAGNTGRSTGPHLHFETRFCGKPINPNNIVSFAKRETATDKYIFRNK